MPTPDMPHDLPDSLDTLISARLAAPDYRTWRAQVQATGGCAAPITPPSWVIELLRWRHADSHGPWVFPSTRGTLRDPDNTRKQLREVVAGTPWQGLHPHAFRHLVATRLDAAGLSAREIADYLGHERISMTQDVYVSRKSTGTNARAALDIFGPISGG